MNRWFYCFPTIVCLLLAVGCSEQPAQEVNKSITVVVRTAEGPVAGATVKVVGKQGAANALIALATRIELKDRIPESQYGQFYQSLPVAGGTEVLTADAAGKAVIQQLRGQDLVVAQSGQNLWMAEASETRDRKLNLGPENMGGKHTFELLSGLPVVSDAVVTAARQAFGKGQFDQARALAHASGSNVVEMEITRGEVSALLGQAEQAIQAKNYEAAEKAAWRANELIPDEPETKAVLDRILTEYGGERLTITGHKGAVNSVAYSADGKFILSGSEDKTVKLWNAANGKEVRTFTGHRGPVTGVAFDPTGEQAVSGSADGTMRLWDVANGQQLQATEALGWKITSVALSPDGKLAATGADDNRVTLWNLPQLSRVRALTGHGWRVTSVVFSTDGNSLLSGSDDDSLKLWDVATGREIRSFRDGLAAVTCVSLSPDGQFGLSGSKDKTVRLWNLETGRVEREFKGHTDTVRCVTFSRDGRFAISGGDDGTVRIWEIGAGKEFRSFTGKMGAVLSVALNPDGHSIVTGGSDGTLKIWQLPRVVWPPENEGQK
ncbi:MAG TPA: WD40 repeat domain-containing protein [Verrucomicrobiae bacterium]|nr:WD40 repeat domain-containing protein [Verrucomicrobiae bacterium]